MNEVFKLMNMPYYNHGVIILNRSSNSLLKHVRLSKQVVLFKYYLVHIRKVSYWLNSKQSVSSYVSLCQDMRFLLAFFLDTQLNLAWGPQNYEQIV